MRWKSAPWAALSISPPQHLPACPEGHETKIVIFSLCWHCKWPERILPRAIFIHLPAVSPSLSLGKPPSLTALGNAKGIGLYLDNVLGIWKWGKQADPAHLPPTTTPRVSFLLLPLSDFLNLLSFQPNYTASLLLFFDYSWTFFLNAVMFSGLALNTWGIGSVAFSSFPQTLSTFFF